MLKLADTYLTDKKDAKSIKLILNDIGVKFIIYDYIKTYLWIYDVYDKDKGLNDDKLDKPLKSIGNRKIDRKSKN